MKNYILLAGLVVAIASQSVFAEDQSSGCGAGWYVFKKNSLLSSSLRTTTNVILLNTIAMTFGTSGCARHDLVQRDKEDTYFAESNHEYLSIQMAEGKGEYVEGFGRALGCTDGALSDFAQFSQAHYGAIFNSGNVDAHQMLRNVREELSKDARLSFACEKTLI